MGKCTFGVAEGQFFGYYVTSKEIHPSSTKVEELLEAKSPHTLRDGQGLNGKLTVLSLFISKSEENVIPLFQTLKGCIEKNSFHSTAEAEYVLQHLKEALNKLPTLDIPIPWETVLVYMSASNEAISFVLAVERKAKQLPIYFVSGALQGPEPNYHILKKIILEIIYVAWSLRRYFEEHQVEVMTSFQLKQILLKPETSVRLAKWEIELGEHDITYYPRTSIREKALEDFLLEI